MILSVLLELERKGAYRGCDSDCHPEQGGVGMNTVQSREDSKL